MIGGLGAVAFACPASAHAETPTPSPGAATTHPANGLIPNPVTLIPPVSGVLTVADFTGSMVDVSVAVVDATGTPVAKVAAVTFDVTGNATVSSDGAQTKDQQITVQTGDDGVARVVVSDVTVEDVTVSAVVGTGVVAKGSPAVITFKRGMGAIPDPVTVVPPLTGSMSVPSGPVTVGSSANVSVKVVDARGVPVAGRAAVTFTVSGHASVTGAGSSASGQEMTVQTGDDGVARVVVSDKTAENVTVSAVLGTGVSATGSPAVVKFQASSGGATPTPKAAPATQPAAPQTLPVPQAPVTPVSAPQVSSVSTVSPPQASSTSTASPSQGSGSATPVPSPSQGSTTPVPSPSQGSASHTSDPAPSGFHWGAPEVVTTLATALFSVLVGLWFPFW